MLAFLDVLTAIHSHQDERALRTIWRRLDVAGHHQVEDVKG